MLILNRFPGQSFHIYLDNGEVVNIKLLNNLPSQFGKFSRIGIDAPKRMNVVRTEVLKRHGIPVPGEDYPSHQDADL